MTDSWAHACNNPHYLGCWDVTDQDSRPTQANSSWDPVFKITTEKWIESVSQVVEHLLCLCKGLSSNPSHTKKKKKEREWEWSKIRIKWLK
jgi:hypothetical protein